MTKPAEPQKKPSDATREAYERLRQELRDRLLPDLEAMTKSERVVFDSRLKALAASALRRRPSDRGGG